MRQIRGRAAAAVAGTLALLLGGAAVGRADEIKIGFIDSARIFEEFEGAKEAQQMLQRESREWEQKADSLKSEISRSLEELESQRPMLSPERLREREQQVTAMRSGYEDYVASIWGSEGRVAQRNAELTKPIIDKVNEILHTICTQEGYSLVLDAAGGVIVFALPALDLTDRVLEELGKEKK